MTNTICLDERYSTTRLVTQEKSEIVNNPENKFETVLFLSEGEGRKGEGGLRTRGYFKKSFEDKSLISIITVVFNGEKYLEETIQSVINQTYPNVEYIIIDGGSTDGTIDIIRKYEDRIDYWVSERDKGIYDAMNKGIQLCLGKLVGIINSDDFYEIDTINMYLQYYYSNSFQILFSNKKVINEDGSLDSILKTDVDSIFFMKSGCSINHPTVFVSINIYKSIGLFDTNFKIAADYDFLLRVYNSDAILTYIDFESVNFRKGGASGDFYKTLYESYMVKIKNKMNLTYAIIFTIRSFMFHEIDKILNYLGLQIVKRIYRKYIGKSRKQ